MRRPTSPPVPPLIRPLAPALALSRLLACVLALATCTLDITAPIDPPPESWDPALNTHPRGSAFQALLDDYVHGGLTGVVFLARTPEGTWNGASGFARIETGVPMLPTHRHHAASVTKMYMATAIMLLVEDGLVDLDAGIMEYLPESLLRPIPNGARATVRQLLGHTSGIPDFSGDMAYDLDFLNDPKGTYAPERLLSYLHGQSALSAPGEGYFYSNANYLLLALLADEVTGGSHAAFITDRILRPLGLEATYYRNEPGYPTPPGLVNSYQDVAGDGRVMNVSDLTARNAEIFFGNAGLIASSADFAGFIEGLLEGRVVGQASLARMQDWRDRSRSGLGLGFIETPFGPGVGHSGGDLGAMSQVRHFPDHDATLVLLTNGGNGGVPAECFRELWDELMELALGDL